MFSTGLIVFRETLEAALFVGILAAATRGVPGRHRWLLLGVVVGVLGSLLMAAGMEQISAWANGLGQDLANACILSLALGMLAWHMVWVSTHAREMTAQAKRLGAEVAAKTTALGALALVVALTVLREGAETVLFVAGLLSGRPGDQESMVLGSVLGLILGTAAGGLVYLGLGRIGPRHIFKVTDVLILFLAGNLASQLARTLQQADWLPWLNDRAWDSSQLLANDSPVGTLLRGLVGYEATPSQLQVIFYIATAVLIALAARAMRASIKLVPAA